MLPSFLVKHQLSWDTKSSESSILNEIKITGLSDAVQGSLNIVVNSGQVCLLNHVSLSLKF